MYFVYAIYNQLRDKIYIGYTRNLGLRLARHNKELPTKKSSYTFKNSGEWKVFYNEEFSTSKEAKDREKQLKSYRGRVFLKEKFKIGFLKS